MQGFSFSTEWEKAGAFLNWKVKAAMLVFDIQTKLIDAEFTAAVPPICSENLHASNMWR